MPTLASVMSELESRGAEKTRITYARHGAPIERTLGVSVAELKLIAKPLKGQQALACELYATGMMEAQYLAGMLADGAKLSTMELDAWAAAADIPMISDFSVAWVSVDHPQARELAVQWIASPIEHIQCCGWVTYAGLVALKPDAALDMNEIRALLATIVATIHTVPDRIRLKMNQFIIRVGSYVLPLHEEALAAAAAIGKLSADMGDTACKIPDAAACIHKATAKRGPGTKKKTIRC